MFSKPKPLTEQDKQMKIELYIQKHKDEYDRLRDEINEDTAYNAALEKQGLVQGIVIGKYGMRIENFEIRDHPVTIERAKGRADAGLPAQPSYLPQNAVKMEGGRRTKRQRRLKKRTKRRR